MKISFHKNFNKYFHKLSTKEKEKTKGHLAFFSQYPFNPLLNNHPLRGNYVDYRSINITGDLRAVFKLINENEAIFVRVGTHSELYS